MPLQTRSNLKTTLNDTAHWKPEPWLLGLLLAVFALAYSYLAIACPLVQVTDLSVWIPRAAKFPGQMDESFWVSNHYTVGYPILLQMGFWLTGDYLDSAKILSVGGSLLALASFYYLSRRFVSPALALGSALLLALNPAWFRYSGIEGTDMPFHGFAIAAMVLCLKALDTSSPSKASRYALLAGLLAGVAYLMRMTALPVAACLVPAFALADFFKGKIRWRLPALILLGFLVGGALQIVPSLLYTGNPFFNKQHENMWWGIYGNSMWSNFPKSAQYHSLREVIELSPQRFLANFKSNLIKSFFTDTNQFLLFWLMLPGIGLGLWLQRFQPRTVVVSAAFLGYLAAVSLAFITPRLVMFALPAQILFCLFCIEAGTQALSSRLPALAKAPIALGVAGLLLMAFVIPDVARLRRPLTAEQQAQIELARLIRDKGVVDVQKVLSLTFWKHDPFIPTKDQYSKAWYTGGVRFTSMRHVERYARQGGFRIVIIDKFGTDNVPGLPQVWSADSARILFHEFYSRAELYGYEVRHAPSAE